RSLIVFRIARVEFPVSSIGDVAVQRGVQRLVVVAAVAADQPDLLQMFFGFRAVALFELPHAVILPGAGVIRIGGERLLVPDLGVFGAAELARGEADQIGDVRMLVMAKRLQRNDAASIILRVIDQRIGFLVAVEELIVGFLARIGLGIRLRIGGL